MLRHSLVSPRSIRILLFVQFIPLLLLPPDSYSMKTQEWWLPMLLVIFAAIAVFQIIARRSVVLWPWNLMAFSQGFNLISRLMLLMPHATRNVGGEQVFNTLYFLLSILSIALSLFFLWFSEQPDVRLGLVRAQAGKI
jgi:hypothetical protein